MPKNLIEVIQRGAAILDQKSLENVAGFYTRNIVNCVAILLIGEGDKKFALMHVDNQTSDDSIASFVQENFSTLGGAMLFHNPKMTQDPVHNTILQENLFKIRSIPVFSGEKIYPTNGNGEILFTFNEARKLACNRNPNTAELEQRNIYDADFQQYRNKVHVLNGAFGDETSHHHFPIDVQFKNGHYYPIAGLMRADVAADLEALKGKDQREIVAWLSSPEVTEKYPHLGKAFHRQPHFVPQIAQEITDYFTAKEKCVLTPFDIPFLPNKAQQEKSILGAARGVNAESSLVTQDGYFTVHLKSDALKKDVRDAIGLDKLRIDSLSAKEERELREKIPMMKIEADPKEDAKIFVTFPLGANNRAIIKNLIASKKPSADVQDTQGDTLKLGTEVSQMASK